MIPISKVQFGEAEEALVLEVLRSGIIAQGPKVAELESRFAEAYGMKHVVAVNNGTVAIVAALLAHGVGPGDEVITSPFTFAATLNAILEVGAKPVFADIRESDFNVNVDLIPGLITENTKAIIPVDLYGQAADMTALTAIASKHNLAIIQDAAQAQGAKHNDVFVGSTHTATFSLYATKNMTTGEGGLISTDSDEVAERLRILRNQGMRARYEYVMSGYNWRLTDLQAAVGIPQLDRYEDVVAQREKNAAFYAGSLTGLNGVELPAVTAGNHHVWHQYTIRVTKESGITRDVLSSELEARGIGTGMYYPKAVYDYEPFLKHPLVGPQDTPVGTRVASEVLSIPIHQYLSEADLATVASAIREIVEQR